MAGTFHQAMAYLGLTAEQNEPQEVYRERLERQPRDKNDAPYDDDFYDYQDEQLETHELGSRQSNAVAAERADIVAERSTASEEPAAVVAEKASPAPVKRQVTAPQPAESAQDSKPAGHLASIIASNSQPAPKPAPQKTVTPASAPAQQSVSYNLESEEQLRQITTIHPRSYNDAKIIGESFRENIPVIMNVTDMGEAEAKRLVDFSAGLAFALHGSIERVTDKVFLLTPTNLEVLAPEGAEMPVALDADASSLFNQG